MKHRLQHLKASINRKLASIGFFLHQKFVRYWFRAFLLSCLFYGFYNKKVDIAIDLRPGAATAETVALEEVPDRKEKRSLLSRLWNRADAGDEQMNLANTFSNMTYRKSDKKEVRDPRKVEKLRKQMNYVDRFAKVAIAEQKRFGIPASITLAQGLLESNAGESRLSLQNNNHFGIKCFSKKCSAGHCRNFTDDHHKDFFVVYKTVWESYRAHSQLLQGKRYKRLFDLQPTDYKGWAHGLSEAGYATDPRYAEKLIEIIEELALYNYTI